MESPGLLSSIGQHFPHLPFPRRTAETIFVHDLGPCPPLRSQPTRSLSTPVLTHHSPSRVLHPGGRLLRSDTGHRHSLLSVYLVSGGKSQLPPQTIPAEPISDVTGYPWRCSWHLGPIPRSSPVRHFRPDWAHSVLPAFPLAREAAGGPKRVWVHGSS